MAKRDLVEYVETYRRASRFNGSFAKAREALDEAQRQLGDEQVTNIDWRHMYVMNYLQSFPEYLSYKNFFDQYCDAKQFPSLAHSFAHVRNQWILFARYRAEMLGYIDVQTPKVPVTRYCFTCGLQQQDLKCCEKCNTIFYCSERCKHKDAGCHKSLCEPNQLKQLVFRLDGGDRGSIGIMGWCGKSSCSHEWCWTFDPDA